MLLFFKIILVYIPLILVSILMTFSLFKYMPFNIYVYPCFLFRKKRYFSTRPIGVGMVIDFTYIKYVCKHFKETKDSNSTLFKNYLLDLYSELLKYKNQTFVITTHGMILRKLRLEEKEGKVKVISCYTIGKRYLWHTLIPPFKKVKFYRIVFKINS